MPRGRRQEDPIEVVVQLEPPRAASPNPLDTVLARRDRILVDWQELHEQLRTALHNHNKAEAECLIAQVNDKWERIKTLTDQVAEKYPAAFERY